MPSQKKSNNKQVYQLKVTLLDIEPPIWRRTQELSDITLHELHWTLLTVMGWHGSHLHEFMIGGEAYAELEYDPHSDAKTRKPSSFPR